MAKKFGGHGFKNLQIFNLAMLGKQAWKFVKYLEALVTRVFKAKYFPQGDFLDDNIGHNPSYAWRSIWMSKSLVRDGICWCIGGGENIPVSNTPWLCDGGRLHG